MKFNPAFRSPEGKRTPLEKAYLVNKAFSSSSARCSLGSSLRERVYILHPSSFATTVCIIPLPALNLFLAVPCRHTYTPTGKTVSIHCITTSCFHLVDGLSLSLSTGFVIQHCKVCTSGTFMFHTSMVKCVLLFSSTFSLSGTPLPHNVAP